MKLPCRFGTHEEDLLARYYSKLDPNMLLFASDLISKHKPLNPQHAHLISTARACIDNLRETIDMEDWRTTASCPMYRMQAAPHTSFDGNGNLGNAPGYKSYGQKEVAYRQLRSALVALRNFNEEIDYQRRNQLEEEHLLGKIIYLNGMHRELCGISDLIHFADRIDRVFRYRRH